MTISLIFDIAIAAILLLCLIVGGVRGFISSLLSVAVFAAALLGSAILANALADSVSDWLTPRVEQYVLDRLTNGHGDEAVSAAAASDNEALAGLVDFDAITGIAKKAMDSAVEAGKNMLEGAVTGMIRSLAYGLLFLVSFLVLTLLLRLLTSPLQLAARAPVLGAVNRLAGSGAGPVSRRAGYVRRRQRPAMDGAGGRRHAARYVPAEIFHPAQPHGYHRHAGVSRTFRA